MTENKILGQTKNKGSYEHFTDSQQKAAGFGRVSAIWRDQCMTYDQGVEKLAVQQEQIVDIRGPLTDWQPVVGSDGAFAMHYKPTGRDYKPTENALANLATKGRMSTWQLQQLTQSCRHQSSVDKDSGEKKVVWDRDRRDSELLRDLVSHHLFNEDRTSQDKERLFRTWKDGSLRAYLSDRYAIVNNLWFIEVMREVIPGGLLSHWRGDADEVFGNILIPDSIRAENDSEYGGMLSIGNSEIGTRKYESCPSVFRAICMNGCIWDQEKGVSIRGIHKGEINLDRLKAEIRENLETQIPLLPIGIERMLGLRAFGCGEVNTRQLFAQLRKDYSIGKKQLQGVAKAWGEEAAILGSTVRTAFGLQASVTRYGQTLENAQWLAFDKIGGNIANMNRPAWDNWTKRAGTLKEKEVDKLVGELTLVG